MRGYYKIVILVFISQLCITIVSLFPRFFNDIRFRMMGAKLFLVVSFS